MAVAVVMDFPDATLEQYDQVLEKMGLQHGGPGPEGALFHWVARTDEGIRIVDVWGSTEQWERFAETSIRPLSAEVGLPEPSSVTMHQVHNYLSAG